MIKKIGIGIVGLIVVVLGAGFLLPASTEVSRSITIDRDASEVYAKVVDFRQFNRWSPWAKRDPETQYVFSGPKTGVKSKMSWKSDHPEVGVGSQEIVETKEYERVRVRLEFEGQGGADAYYLIKQTNNSSEITWGFKMDHGQNIISRYMGLMFDGMVGPDYEQGLADLKSLLESERKVEKPPRMTTPEEDAARHRAELDDSDERPMTEAEALVKKALAEQGMSEEEIAEKVRSEKAMSEKEVSDNEAEVPEGLRNEDSEDDVIEDARPELD